MVNICCKPTASHKQCQSGHLCFLRADVLFNRGDRYTDKRKTIEKLMNSKEQSKETILFQRYVKAGENWDFEGLGSLKLRPQK